MGEKGGYKQAFCNPDLLGPKKKRALIFGGSFLV